ncbi:MAG TPA: TlpA disulfide reductase family protein [Candidatus Dormibacteraeota bacterium]|nr:TlpA disulfide reductase family protein [Candidatus Dormibacteraeota bacterium]
MTKPSYAAIALLTALALAGCGSTNKSAAASSAAATAGDVASTSTGVPAPPWSEPLSKGGVLASASLRGKPVYLNFFASWCPPCNAEAPSINVLYKKYRARGLQVVGVDVLENAAKAQGFREKYHLAYPVVVDSGQLRDAYNINGLPVHVFIGSDGTIRQIVVGEMEPAAIKASIKAIL